MTNKERTKRDDDREPRKQHRRGPDKNAAPNRSADLRGSLMMAHLLDALESGQDIGHYGRLTFVMVARHFLSAKKIVELLSKQPDVSADDAELMLRDVQERGYNPPSRERILEWMQMQEFPICPDADDPAACNVYRDLQFPDEIYEQIEEFREERYEAGENE